MDCGTEPYTPGMEHGQDTFKNGIDCHLPNLSSSKSGLASISGRLMNMWRSIQYGSSSDEISEYAEPVLPARATRPE